MSTIWVCSFWFAMRLRLKVGTSSIPATAKMPARKSRTQYSYWSALLSMG